MTKRSEKPMAPEVVRIVYASFGQLHVFKSPDLPGMLVSGSDLKRTFERLAGVVGDLVEARVGAPTPYKLDETFDDFVTQSKKEHRLVVELQATRDDERVAA